VTLSCSVESEFSLELQGRPKRLIRSKVVAIYVYRGVRMVCDKSGGFRVLMCMGIRYCLDR